MATVAHLMTETGCVELPKNNKLTVGGSLVVAAAADGAQQIDKSRSADAGTTTAQLVE